MARRIHEEDIKLNIIVGNNQAQKKIYDLEAANRKLREEQTELVKVKNRLEAQGKKESAEYKNAVTRLRQLKKEYNANRTEIRELTASMGVMGMTMAQLRSRANVLRSTLNNMIPGSSRYKELQGELREVNARIQQLNATAKAQSLTWSSAANWLNKYQTLLLGFVATVTGVTFTLQRWIDYSGKLSDQQADVRKTTGMTAQEVDELTMAFGRLETRTSRINLLKIAEEGGRIGIAKDEMAEFVEVMDKASVALGDSFTGGVEEVASVLGKLKFLFEETNELGVDQAYNAIGSAINNLGADGVATERNIAEFATRLGSLPRQLKPTAAEALALGAAFEESGIQAEIASRAYSIFLNRAAKNTGEFAKVLGISTEEAKAMIDENPVEFFLQFGEALGKSSISATQMSKMLQDMGINADGANKIVGAISNNTQRFRDQINLSNKSMAEATSLTDEFNVKNNTLQGTLDKINKTLAGWFSSETLIGWMESAINWFAKLIGATEDADGSGKKWREGLILAAKLLTILIAGIASYNAGMKMYTIWTARATAGSLLWNLQLRIQNTLASISVIRTGLMTAANALFTQGIRAAIAQIRIMNAVLGVSPWGAVAAAIGLVVSALVLFRNETDKAITKQKLLNNLNAEAEKSIAGQRKQIELLLKVARDENLEKEKRISALNRLNQIIPGYNHLLNLEKINTLEASAAVKKHTDELYRNARAKALQAKFDELESKKIDVEQKTEDDYRGWASRASARVVEFFGGNATMGRMRSEEEIERDVRKMWEGYNLSEAEIQNKIQQSIIGSGVLDQKSELKEIADQQKIIEAELYKLLQEDPGAGNESTDLTDLDFGDSKADKKAESAAEKAKRERERRMNELISENQKLSQELLAIQRANEDAQMDIMEEGFQKEQSQIQREHTRRIEDLKKQIVDEETLEKLRAERRAASAIGDTQRINLLDGVIEKIEQKNAELNNSILQSTITYEHRRGTIHAKYANQRILDRQKEIDEERKALETAYMEEVAMLGSVEAIKERLKDTLSRRELNQIKTWEDAKKALKAQYNQEEIDTQIAHTEELIADMKAAIESGTFEGFDISLMSDEEKDKFIEQIEELKQKLIELGYVKASLMNENAGEESTGIETYGFGGNVDILGMTPENWQLFFENLEEGQFQLGEMIAVVGMLQNAMQTYFNYVNQAQQREIQQYEAGLNKKRTSLKRQLDQGIISQEQYDRKVQKLEEEADKRRAMMEYEAAMNQWRQSLINANIGLALGIMNALAVGPPQGYVFAAITAALGAVQLAMIAKNKPVKGYEEGLYPDGLFDVVREQDGKSFRARYGGETRSGVVSTPTVFMAGERGPEMIIDDLAFRRLSPELKSDLFREIAQVKGYQSGLYPDYESGSSSKLLEDLMAQNIALMQQNNSLLQQMSETHAQAYIVLDYEEMRKFKKVEEDYTIHQSKNRV